MHSEDRVGAPMVRDGGAHASRCRGRRRSTPRPRRCGRSLDIDGPGSIAVLGGARGTNEDAYVWARLAKGVLGTDHVDAQLADGLPADVVLGLPRATIADLDRAAAIVLLAPDLKEELPVLAPPGPPRRRRSRRPARRDRARGHRPHPRRDRGAAPRAR